MSNVPSWRRNLSRIEYLYKTYQLAIRIGQIVHTLPKKYYSSYGDILIKDCEKALFYGRTANNIWVGNNKELLTERLSNLAKMRAAVDNVATYVYIWGETVRKHDGFSADKMSKIYDRENEIGDMCNDIISMIDKLKKSDKERFKNRNNSES